MTQLMLAGMWVCIGLGTARQDRNLSSAVGRKEKQPMDQNTESGFLFLPHRVADYLFLVKCLPDRGNAYGNVTVVSFAQ